jgi:putative protease
MTPAGNYSFPLKEIHSDEGEKMEVAPGSGYIVRIPAPEGIDTSFGLLMKSL